MYGGRAPKNKLKVGGWTGSRLMKWKSCKAEASSSAETITSCLGLFLTLCSNLHASFCSMPESGERHLGYVMYVHLESEVLYLPFTWENSQTCSANQAFKYIYFMFPIKFVLFDSLRILMLLFLVSFDSPTHRIISLFF